jgi:hypothetical protein
MSPESPVQIRPSIYHAARAKAFANGYRLEKNTPKLSEDITRLLSESEYDPSSAMPSTLKKLIIAEAREWNLPTLVILIISENIEAATRPGVKFIVTY